MSDLPEPFSPDDPRLSAYVLGEMADDERSAFEAELNPIPRHKSIWRSFARRPQCFRRRSTANLRRLSRPRRGPRFSPPPPRLPSLLPRRFPL